MTTARVVQVSSSRPEPLLLDLLASGRSVEIQVTGGSMSPVLRSDDVVTVIPIGECEVGLGDVVAFPRPDGRLVMHRVVALKGARVQTRGDAVSSADAWIDRQRVVGRVEVLRRAGEKARWGLGPERRGLAWLSRVGWLRPCLRPLRWWVRRAR